MVQFIKKYFHVFNYYLFIKNYFHLYNFDFLKIFHIFFRQVIIKKISYIMYYIIISIVIYYKIIYFLFNYLIITIYY